MIESITLRNISQVLQLGREGVNKGLDNDALVVTICIAADPLEEAICVDDMSLEIELLVIASNGAREMCFIYVFCIVCR